MDAVLDRASRLPHFAPAARLDRSEALPARAFAAYVVATPLLWAGGLLAPVGGLLLLWLVARAGPRILLSPIAGAWILVGVAQAVSVVVNGVAGERSIGFIAYRLISSGVTGWILLGLALAVGARYRIGRPLLVRAVCVLGGYFLLFGAAALLVHSVTGLHELAFPTPLALLLPGSAPAVEFSFTMHLFSTEDLLGRELPRLVLFYPWAVMLGFAGIAVFFIAQLERNIAVRLVGSAGGLLAVIGSQGRTPMLALLILLPVQVVVQRFDRRALPLIGAFGLLLIALLLPFGVTPASIVRDVYDAVAAMRPGSSTVRELSYMLSIAGFLASPVLGQGWVGDFIAPGSPVPVGSHSSFYGVLYTGGAMTFGLFAIALGLTLIALLRRAGRGPVERTALLILLALALLSYGECLYSFVLPCLPLLLFVGSALADDDDRQVSWRHP